jgi:hypothetical protein
MADCPEYDRLHAEVENVLGNLAQVITTLLELFRSHDLDGVHRLDKELELTVEVAFIHSSSSRALFQSHFSTAQFPFL